MAFKFSLEQVLKYRTQLEQEAKMAYAAVEMERQKEEEAKNAILYSLEEQQGSIDRLSPEKIQERWLIDNFVKALKEDLIKALERVAYWEKKANEAKAVLTEKAKDKKILEKLKEKQEKQYVHEEKIREQQFFDEITAGKAARKP